MESILVTTRPKRSVFLLLLYLMFTCCVYSVENIKNIRIPEGISPGTILLKLPAKNGFRYILTYSSSQSSNLFHLNPRGILSTKATLDYEDERGYVFDLVVVCREDSRSEGGTVTNVRITVLDVNDNTPKFPKDLYTASVPENSRPGTYLKGLEGLYADDGDSGLNSVHSYIITAGNEERLFAVEMIQLAGVKFLHLKTTKPIDREKKSIFVLTIQVRDGGNPVLSSEIQIRVNILDENDCYPMFHPQIYSRNVNENVAIGTSVLQVTAIDDDDGRNGEVYYYFTSRHDFFSINAHTGVVTITSQLSFEQGNYFKLNVVAVDRGSTTKRNTSTIIKISIQDVLDFPPKDLQKPFPNPQFETKNNYVKIREDLPVDAAIIHVKTATNDEYTRPHFYFELFPSKLRDTFHVNPKSGEITLVSPLDFEKSSLYILKIRAKDYNTRIFVAETEVRIEVVDVDENLYSPVFRSSTIVKTIVPTSPKNTIIWQLSANDKDLGNNGLVKYSVTGGSGAGRFILDEDQGFLKTLGSQNIQDDSRYDLHIEARDGGEYPRFARMYLLLIAGSYNQKRPYFHTPSQKAIIQENSDQESFVAAVKAEFKGKLTTDEDNAFEYSINEGHDNRFSIGKETGVIYTTTRLDRERKSEYTLDILARIKGAADNMSTVAQVVVTVTDVNDNAPKFIQESFQIKIKENEGPIDNLLCLLATDADDGENANLTYSIIGGNSLGLFTVHPTLGILSVRKSLDFEKAKVHDMIVKVSDNGKPRRSSTAKVKIIVEDANDPPVFVQTTYEVIVSDITKVGTIIAVLDLNDEDNNKGYSSVNVEEDAQPGNTLTIINATDEDSGKSGQFKCTIDDIDADEMDTFNFRTVNQGCALTLSNYLEYSHRSKYTFQVRATDQAEKQPRRSATAIVKVRVRDGNNNYPTFPQSSYWIALPEDTALGTTVLKVKATDFDSGPNADITYESSASDVFPIHNKDGTITLRQRATPNKKYTFTITASDKGSPIKSSVAKVLVSVHSVSDTPPSFRKKKYFKEIPENFKVNAEVIKLEAMNGAGSGMKLSYHLVGGDPKMQFRIDSNTGWLSLRQSLDYEKIKEYHLVVRVVQQGWTASMPELPAETIVTIKVIDVNDNPPRFAIPQDPYVISVDQLLSSGSVVAKLTAYDRDTSSHGTVTYSIENAVQVPFTINKHTGVLRSQNTLQYSEHTLHRFVIRATDSTFPFNVGKANIEVYVSNVRPPVVFKKKHHKLDILENTEVGSMIIKLRPKIRDQSHLNYFFTRGNKAGTFCIDVTGEIRLRERLDREKKERYALKISAKKGSVVSEGPSVNVRVSDINDNAPKFLKPVYKVHVQENLRGGYQIGEVLAVDPDKGKNAIVIYSIVNYENAESDRRFVIDLNTGVIRSTTTLDRETLDTHVLTVRAENTGYPELSRLVHVFVIVKDENDNMPTFSSKIHEINIPLNFRVKAPVLKVTAHDADRDANGAVRYRILTGNDQGFFAINPYNGELWLEKPLEGLESHQLHIQARDSGRPLKNTSTNIKINVCALEGPPRFPVPNFTGQVVENVPGGQPVVQIKAASLDPVMYYIISGNHENKFKLHPGNGQLMVTKALDYEEQSQYVINVMATDLKNRISKVDAVVNIVNVNDNFPMFVNIKNGFIEGSALADVSIGSAVMSVKALDKDKSDRLMYSIDDKVNSKYFEILPDGTLKTKQVIRSLLTPVVFKVGVRDNGRPPNTAFALVRLVLLRYQLLQAEHKVKVSENLAVGSLVTKLRPAIHVNNAQYSIVSPLETSFQIDSLSGIVTIKRKIDFEKIRQHQFIAKVQNSLDDRDYTNIDVVVTVLDANDNHPKFTMNKTDGLYLALVNNNANPGTVVLALNATDRDSHYNGQVRYRIDYDRDRLFQVDSDTGVISTRDRSLYLAWYNITVAAYDLGKPSLETKAIINVKTGRYPPLFEESEYEFNLDENTQSGVTVGEVKAKSFSGAILWYSIKDNNKFDLDSNTGRLTLPNPLDYERDSNIIHLKISAVEVGIEPSLRSSINVKIYVRDVNDNTPEFLQQRYRDTLPETAPIGTSVLAVSARDLDSGINGQFRYFAESDYFAVDPYTGWITTKRELDYETIPRHAFSVAAQDGGIPARNGTTRVIVELTNVNDNKPVFSQELYNLFVAENAAAGQVIGTVKAIDKDSDEVKYSILSGENTTNFLIDSKTGVLRLTTTRRPDLKGPFYFMNISATDGMHVSKAALVVAIEDVNNHKPVFKDCAKYKPKVREHLPARTFVIQVTAEDKDSGKNGEIEYSIEKTKNSPYHFMIDRESGIVTTLLEFDRENKANYQLHIIARDGGSGRQDAERLMGFCQVNVEIEDINDHPPVFQNKHYEATIGEDFDIGRSVLHVSANDRDAGTNAVITYSFNKPSDYFEIDNVTGTITTKAKLLGETRKFPLRVVARDNGTPHMKSGVDVTITVFGDGNTPPVFDKTVYVARVKENVPTSHRVIKVTARANNDQTIFYSLVPGNLPSTNNPKRFQIGTLNGEIQTSHLLDYETTANFSLTIRAETSSNPPGINFATLKIFLEDVNDSPPEFNMPRYQGHVSENAPIGTTVIKVSATDLDTGENGRVTYSFVKRTKKFGFWKHFSLDKDRGVITTRKVFNREARGRYTLVVDAKDHGVPFKKSTTIVEVIIKDENDNPPVFEQQAYNISIFEDVSVGADVIKVSATDRDLGNNAKVSYQITRGNTGAVFEINREFGTINIASSLDREKKQFYKLEVTARDGKNSGRATVNVKVKDVNDNNPKFENQTYERTIYELERPGTFILQLVAHDPDAGVGGVFEYAIGGQGVDAFTIDPVTGILSTTKELDREKKSRYDFMAFAVDAPGLASRRTGTADITVIVRDVNDNRPEFPHVPYEGHVQENQNPGASVIMITAVDNDDPNEGGNAKMTYELLYDADGVFEIDKYSGLIRTTRKLDREAKDLYKVKVGAQDMGQPPLRGEVNVKIKVDDANDQKPRFIRRIFKANVSEAADPGTTILKVKATDNDTGINAKLRYNIEDGNEDRHFTIEEDTGKLIVAKSLDFEDTTSYVLQVKVRDSGTPPFSDTAEVLINVLDYNDNPPVFDPISYTKKFLENIAVGTKLLQVTAKDRDSTAINKGIIYSIEGGDPHGLFNIHARTGEIFLEKPLDKEKVDNHELVVIASNIQTSNTSRPLYGKGSVMIQVIDVNDNGPHFDSTNLTPEILENEVPGKIMTIIPTDPDSNPLYGGPFIFGILQGGKGLFNMTIDGLLWSNAVFDREKQDRYPLLIWGKDSQGVRNTTTLVVHIKDVNDHQHQGAHLELLFNNYKGHFNSGAIGYVYVKDKDTDDKRIYKVVDKSSDVFVIDESSGAIICKEDPAEGLYFLKVKVSDDVRDGEKIFTVPVESTVKIRVRTITDEAVKKSVAIRIRGKMLEDFIKKYFISFQESVAEALGTTKDYVDLFSIQNVSDSVKPASIDVRFAVHGSPYYNPEKLIAILKANRKNLRPFDVVSIGIDPCQAEPCQYGSCRNTLRAPGKVHVIKIGSKSFTSIVVYKEAICEDCNVGRIIALTCEDKPCRNGGTCKNTPTGYHCQCSSKYKGKNCELTTRSFKDKEWIWLPPLQQCRRSTLSLEFATRNADGLILYAGPNAHVQASQGDVFDFLAIELVKGRVHLSLSLGNVYDVLMLSVPSYGLNDGRWHHIEVYRNETYVQLVVDKCKNSVIKEGSSYQKASENRTLCEISGRLKKQNKRFLNVDGPLQLGGISNRDMMYPSVNNKDYTGCIRNVINDGVLYDLSTPSESEGSREGCPVMDKHCEQVSCNDGECISSWTGHQCRCPMGKYGDTCSKQSEPMSFKNQSMTQYLFSKFFKYDPRESIIELRARTRDKNGGILVHSIGTEKGEYSSLSVVREKPNPSGKARLIVVYSFNLGDGEGVVRSNVDVGDGKWFSIKVHRYRTIATLIVKKKGIKYESTGYTRGKHMLLKLDPIRTYIGGIPQSITISARKRRSSDSIVKEDFVGCIDDVRLHGYHLQLNETEDVGTGLSKGIHKGCKSNACSSSSCAATEWCYDAWQVYVCYPRLCTSNPCKNGGVCVESVDENDQNKFYCKCKPEFQGTLCEIGRAVVLLRPDIGFENGLIIGIVLFLFIIIISSCIVFMYIKRSRRDSYNVTVEEVFKRDNVADYHIDGGVEEDVDRHFGDCIHSFNSEREHFSANGGKGKLMSHYHNNDSNKSDRGYSGSSDASPTFILLRPVMTSTRKTSASPSGKSSEDEFFDSGDYHYGRAVAVDLSRGKRPIQLHEHKPKDNEQQRRSNPEKVHITTNPLINGKRVEKGSNSCKGPLDIQPPGSSSTRSHMDDKSEVSSSDEGFASSPMTHSPPSSQEDGPTHKISSVPPVKVETPWRREQRTKSQKRHPVKSVPIIHDDVPFPPDKNFDAGSNPDVVSSPPEKVTSPGELVEQRVPRCPSPSIRLHESNNPPNDTSEAKRNGSVPGKKFQNRILDVPDNLPPPYSYDKCSIHDDFPPPPEEAYAYAKEPKHNKRPKNPISIPHPSNFLPRDCIERYSYEGGGSPSGSLSSLGSDGSDNVTWESVNQFGGRFRNLAGIYGMPPSVSFSPHDEIID